jgi:hypothetical protein
MTSVTMKTHPSPQIVNYSFSIGTTDTTSPAFYDMLAYLLSQYPSLADAGVSGYSYWTPYLQYAPGVYVSAYLGDFVVQDTQDPSVIEDLFAPVFAHINATWPDTFSLASPTATTHPSFQSWYAVHYDTSTVGNDTYVGSRLLSRPALCANLTASAAAYRAFAARTGLATAYLVSGPGVFDTAALPGGGPGAANPAWRAAYVHATTAATAAHQANLTARADALQALGASVAALRRLAPDSGAYVNEADPYEPDWQHAFWGANYGRLLAIKRATDPNDVFWCHPCVGNERWEEVGDLLCRKEGAW